MIAPKDSDSFVSALGHLDRRVDWDPKIRPGNTKYFALLSALASKLSYENTAFIRRAVEHQWKVLVFTTPLELIPLLMLQYIY